MYMHMCDPEVGHVCELNILNTYIQKDQNQQQALKVNQTTVTAFSIAMVPLIWLTYIVAYSSMINHVIKLFMSVSTCRKHCAHSDSAGEDNTKTQKGRRSCTMFSLIF